MEPQRLSTVVAGGAELYACFLADGPRRRVLRASRPGATKPASVEYRGAGPAGLAAAEHRAAVDKRDHAWIQAGVVLGVARSGMSASRRLRRSPPLAQDRCARCPGLIVRDSGSNPAGPGGTVATARAGSRKTLFCTMPRFLRTMSGLLLRRLRPQVTGSARRRWGLDLVRSWPQRAPWSALSRRQWTTPLAVRIPAFMGYCGVHSAEFGAVWAGDLGRSGAAAPTALASWRPDL